MSELSKEQVHGLVLKDFGITGAEGPPPRAETEIERLRQQREIASIVHALNAAGISTVASCSGHGMRPGRISLADGRELFVLPSYDRCAHVGATDCGYRVHGL